MRSRPLVSILIPAHNAGSWIAETIASAINQTWCHKEIIVVDDGSTDDTLQIARTFQSSHVQVIPQANAGAAAARNKAFMNSRGDWIQWLDADDLLAPTKVARQLQALEPSDCTRTLLSGPWGKFYYRTSKARFAPSPHWGDLTPAEWMLTKMESGSHMQTATWLVSRELAATTGPWDTRLLSDDDGEYFARVQVHSARIRFVPHATVFYREIVGPRLSYVGASDRKMEALLLSIELQLEYLDRLVVGERARCAATTYLQKYMFDFLPERPDLVDRLQALAAERGATLHHPRSPWKYWPVHKLFGWNLSKQAQLRAPSLKQSVYSAWDKWMSQAEWHHVD